MNDRPRSPESARNSGQRVPMHWFMFLSICVTGIVILGGIVAISDDQKLALEWGSQSLEELNRSAGRVDRLLSRQIPIRKEVEQQRILVNRFAYEFDLFVAREEPDISALENALNQMVASYRGLEKHAGVELEPALLRPLKENINMAIGIFEEAAEFERVGFGEIYRLAEESKEAVANLISAMSRLERVLDMKVVTTSDQVNLDIKATTANARHMLGELDRISFRNQATLWAILIILLSFQALFLYLFKKRISDFSRLTGDISRHKDLSLRIFEGPDDDLGRLAQSFNRMMDSLEQTSRSMAFLDGIIESMDDAVLVLSPDGIIEQANSHACLMSGLPAKAMKGSRVESLFTEPVPGLAEAVSQKRYSGPWEYRFNSLENRELTTLVSITPLPVLQDADTRQLCIIRDISLIKEMEQKKIESEKIALEKSKYALIGQVAGKMAHDFNNVLGIIMGNAELSILECPDGAIKQTLELIYEQTVRGKNLTRNLVAFAKTEAPRQTFLSASQIIDVVVQLMKKDLMDITVNREDEKGLPQVYADPGMMEHALVNLIQNAVHALSLSPDPCIWIRSYAEGDQVCIEVRDNGCGIPEGDLERIFDPSFTLKGSRDIYGHYRNIIKGTGYGLANVKKYIDQHHGRIHAENCKEKGARFNLCLPAARRKEPPDQQAEIKKAPVFTNKQILVVEDETDILDVQYKLLTRLPAGHDVETAVCAQEAIALFKQKRFDLVSLDYVLKDGSNGMEVYTRIRETDKTTPVLFVSGNIEFLESIDRLQKEDPLVDHLSKPCEGTTYLDAVNHLLLKAQQGLSAGGPRLYICP